MCGHVHTGCAVREAYRMNRKIEAAAHDALLGIMQPIAVRGGPALDHSHLPLVHTPQARADFPSHGSPSNLLSSFHHLAFKGSLHHFIAINHRF